ncbi:FG-GAP-like repeat-containing protein [Archangium gephyra]|uniref:toxin TcdB middle/N-terminal domain-containing protein n=1 Tax=Archangium gephyra TaxID=48 RepID=UPI0035D464E5
MSLDIGFSAQTPSLPQGGGATSGLGETFTPDLHTGTGTFSLPLDCPNGPNDIGPRLTLRYDTGSGNGPFGLGVALPLPRLVRSLARGFPRYDTADTLMLEGAGELLDLGGGAFRPQVDGGAWRAEALGDGFRCTDREGLFYELGTDAGSRLVGEDASGRSVVFAWHLAKVEDALGNAALFRWRRDGGQLYLDTVAYGAYEVRFLYEPRPDPMRWGRAGFLVTTALRCKAIELHLPAEAHTLARRWTLGYQQAANGASLLAQVTLSGFDANGVELATPALKLAYTDFNVRGLERVRAPEGAAPGPLSREDRRVELVDWDGDGLPDLLEVGDGGRARVWPNQGAGRWGHPRSVGTLPGFASASDAVGFADLNGDGAADLFRANRVLDGYIPRAPGGGFARPVRWKRAPAITADARNARFVDLDGDGSVDLLTSTGNSLLLYYREDPEGWSERPQVVSRAEAPVRELADPRVFLADMTGDGSADLVRVDGGGVTYWPYLGRGRWAAPVVMKSPPALPFDVRPDEVLVTDVDGDGCADVVLLHGGRVTWWLNQGGNGFGPPHVIDALPTVSMRNCRLVDLEGSGTAGLLWSVPGTFDRGAAYFYLDFTGDAKPYLLSRIDNGIGRVREIRYSTSAKQAALAAREGAPWGTSLPVVVPVVVAMTLTDATTGRTSTTTWRYADGRFDGLLREFAGFGRVEQDEVGDATAPTLRLSSWFHVGLDATTGEEPRTLDERQRLRAIRGRLYRSESSSPDGSPQAGLPFERLEQRWAVDEVATSGGTVHVPKLAGTVTSTFERAVTPVAVITTTNVTWDAALNVTETVETSERPGHPEESRTLRTLQSFAVDPAGRFLSKSWRTRQFDGSGGLLADTVTEYDHAPEGNVGAQGLITRRSVLVLTDALALEVYGADMPDFSALGYHRRDGVDGWWVTQAAYERTDGAAGLHGRVTGPLGAVTAFEFDATKSFPVKVTDPHGNALTTSFDPRLCRATQLTDASGAAYAAAYDAISRLLSVIEPGDTVALPTVHYEYRTGALPIEVTKSQRARSGEAGTVDTRERFDGMGLLLERRVRDESGEVIVGSYVYGARGHLARTHLERRAPGASYVPPDDTWPHAAMTYDALGRLVRQQAPDGRMRTVLHGPGFIEEADEEDSRSDAGAPHAGTVTRRHLDATGRVSAVEQRLGARTLTSTYDYDLKGHLVRQVNALGQATRLWYDLLGRTLRVDRPESSTTSVLDAAGNAVEARAGTGRVFRTFDLCNRPIAVRHTSRAAEPVIRLTYHDMGRPAPAEAGAHTRGGRVVRIDDEGGTTVFDYDARGRMAHKLSRPAGLAASFALDLVYRSDGQLERVTYPDGGSGRRVLDYQYDSRGLLQSSPGFITRLAYDLAGRRTDIQYGNGTVQTSAYEPLTGRLASMELTGPGGSLRKTQYTLDGVGNLLRVDSPDAKLRASYTYDDLYRLTGASFGGGESWTYAYDDAGNLTHKSDVGDFHYGEAGAPASCLTSAGTGAFTYSERGEMAQTPWGTQTFDPLGHLVRIERPDGTARIDFRYDFGGTRVAARTSGAATPAVDLLTPDRFYAIEDGVLVLHLFDGDRLAARERTGAPRVYLHPDHLGSVVVVTDTAGGVVETRRYDPYGAVLERTGADAHALAGFTGGLPEEWSGLVLLGARYYAPRLGRFVSPDTVVQDLYEPLTWVSYAYCRNNPASYVDPSGHSFWKVFTVVVAAVALVALVVLSVVTFGATTPLLVVGIGIVAGGVVGGLAAAKNGGDLGDILTGVLVGAAVGGWAAFASVYAGAAVAAKLGVHGVLEGLIAGGVNGAINGAAMGFAAGFAGGKNNGLMDVLSKVLQGALVGLVTGAALGALSAAIKPPTQSIQEGAKNEVNAWAHPTSPQAPPSGNAGMASELGRGAASAPGPTSLGDLGTRELGRIGGIVGPHAAHLGAQAAANLAVQVFIVDASAGAWDLYIEDLKQYLRTHDVNLGPFNFFKSEW